VQQPGIGRSFFAGLLEEMQQRVRRHRVRGVAVVLDGADTFNAEAGIDRDARIDEQHGHVTLEVHDVLNVQLQVLDNFDPATIEGFYSPGDYRTRTVIPAAFIAPGKNGQCRLS
jgi:hypothetical protein